MSYEKGMFAFFNGNSADLEQGAASGRQNRGLHHHGNLAGPMCLLDIRRQKGTVQLKVGDGLRQENGKWVFADAGRFVGGVECAGHERVRPALQRSTAGSTPAAPRLGGRAE